MATPTTPVESREDEATEAADRKAKRKAAEKKATEALLGAAGVVSLAMLIRELTK